MKVAFNPPPPRIWESYFQSRSVVQHGRGAALLGGFKGRQFQRGHGLGSVLGSLLRAVLPVAKKVGKTVGKEVLRTTAHVAGDALSGRELAESLEHRGKAGAAKLLAKGVARLDSGGSSKRRGSKKKKGQKGRGALGFVGRTGAASKRRGIKAPVRRAGLIRRKVKVQDQLGSYFA
jgi:hypothetical protein